MKTVGCAYERYSDGTVEQYHPDNAMWCKKCHRIFCLLHAKQHAKYKGTKLVPMSVNP